MALEKVGQRREEMMGKAKNQEEKRGIFKRDEGGEKSKRKKEIEKKGAAAP